MFFYSSRLTLSFFVSLLLTSVSAVASDGYPIVSALNSTPRITTSESFPEFLLAQRGFRGFSGRYGVASSRRGTPFRRGSCLPDNAEVTALFPTEEIITDPRQPENLGKDRSWYTAEAYPIIYIHVPENSALTAEVVIEDSHRNIVYSALVTLPDSPVSNNNNLHPQGFIGIDLSEKAQELQIPPLEASEAYLWEVQLICNNVDRSGNPLVTGWITRIDQAETTEINNAIANLGAEEMAWVYTDNGIWYSALNALAHNYLEGADSQGWITLLESVGYERIAKDPLVGMAEVQQIFIGDLPEIQF
jgi:hypothetical protein